MMIEALIRFDVNYNYKDKKSLTDTTLLYLAVTVNSFKLVEQLFKSGANPDIIAGDDRMPCLLLACKMGHDEITKLLIEHAAHS